MTRHRGPHAPGWETLDAIYVRSVGSQEPGTKLGLFRSSNGTGNETWFPYTPPPRPVYVPLGNTVFGARP